MSFAFLAFYTGDYLRDTRGLSPMAHGVYLLFLFNQWDTRHPIPLDEQDAAGIANCRSQDEIECMRRVLNRFFIRAEDGYYSRRMQLEIEKSAALSAKRKFAGFKGYQARVKQLPSKSRASGEHQHLPPPPPPSSPPPPRSKTLSSSQANIDHARQLLKFLNQKAGRFFRDTPATLKPIVARLKEGNSVSDCKAMIVRRWLDWRDKPDMQRFMRPDTLFNATKFAQYMGDVPTEDDHADQGLS